MNLRHISRNFHAVILLVALHGYCFGQTTMSTEDITALSTALAPTGELRVALNLGNGVLAQQDPDTGELAGISVELSRAIADYFGLQVSFSTYNSANMVFEQAANNVWDLSFMGVEPARQTMVSFTRPYVYIEGTYMVPANSNFQQAAELDAPGITIAAGSGSAYDLFLTRTINSAELVRRPTSALAIDWFLAGNTDVVAGVRQTLLETAADRPDLRVLPDSFMRIEQAMVVPADRPAAVITFLDAFIAERIASGFIRAGLDATGQFGAIVPEQQP